MNEDKKDEENSNYFLLNTLIKNNEEMEQCIKRLERRINELERKLYYLTLNMNKDLYRP